MHKTMLIVNASVIASFVGDILLAPIHKNTPFVRLHMLSCHGSTSATCPCVAPAELFHPSSDVVGLTNSNCSMLIDEVRDKRPNLASLDARFGGLLHRWNEERLAL